VIMSDRLLAAVSADTCEPDQTRTWEWLRQANRILELQRQCGRDLTVGVSQSLQGYAALPALYQQAVRALNMRFLLGRDEVYVYPGVTEPVCQKDRAVEDAITICLPTHPYDIALSGACAVAAAVGELPVLKSLSIGEA